jgi:hypothetical protein
MVPSGKDLTRSRMAILNPFNSLSRSSALIFDEAQTITKVLARRQPRRQLAKRKRVGGDEPHAVLDAMGGTVAESLGRHDGVLGQGRQAK